MFPERTVNPLDVLLVAVIAAFGIRGLFRGFIREAFAVIAWVGGLVLAFLYSAELAPIVAERLEVGRPVDRALAGIGIFLAVYVGSQLVGWILHRIVHAIFLGPIDRLAGLLLGAAKGLVFCGLALWVASTRFGSSVDSRIESAPLAATVLGGARDVIDELAPPREEEPRK